MFDDDRLTREDREFLRVIKNWMLSLTLGLVVIGGLATVVSNAYNLAWFPWDVKMRTEMIRNSNSYGTTQIAMLRNLQIQYYSPDATIEQKLAIMHQMQNIADLIPGQVPVDIAQFLHDKGHH